MRKNEPLQAGDDDSRLEKSEFIPDVGENRTVTNREAALMYGLSLLAILALAVGFLSLVIRSG